MNFLRFRRLSVLASVTLIAGCWLPKSGPPPSSSRLPALDADRRARLIQARTQLKGPIRLIFDWSVREPGLRSGGRGVARLEPPTAHGWTSSREVGRPSCALPW